MSFDEAAARERLRFRQLLNVSSLGPSAWIVCSKHGFTARDPYQREECVWCLAERNAPEECGPCGHPAGWHLHGPETWGDCDGADCDCEMYTPRSEWDAVDFGAGWL